MAREPIADKLPRIGRARDLDIEFMELFADITAELAALRAVVSAHPQITDDAKSILKEREEAVVSRFERIMNYLSKGELGG